MKQFLAETPFFRNEDDQGFGVVHYQECFLGVWHSLWSKLKFEADSCLLEKLTATLQKETFLKRYMK